MKTAAAIACILALPIFSQEQTPDIKLLGKWQVIKLTVDGEDAPEGEINNMAISFPEKGKAEFLFGESRSQKSKCTVNVSQSPYQIDFEREDGAESITGIFKYDGDNLVLFLRRVDGDTERPKEFGDGSKDGEALIVLKRAEGN